MPAPKTPPAGDSAPADPPKARDGTPRAIDAVFARRTLFVFAAAALIILLWHLVDVAMFGFAAVIVAVLLRSLADPLRRHTPLNGPLSLLAAGALIIGVLGAAGWLFGSLIGEQITALAAILPNSMDEVRARAAALPFGSQLAEPFGDVGSLASSLKGLAGRVGGYALTVAGVVTNSILAVFAGVFLAIEPARARQGFLLLIPRGPRASVGRALDATGVALRLWLLGTGADMLVVGVLTALGAWIVGLPSPLALGLLAGIAAFVPILGPIASAVPGLLVALQMGPDKLLWTLVMYVAVQQMEGNLVYPFIQRRAAHLPPYLCLLGVMSFGALLGPIGVIPATPLLVVIFTMIKMLYVRDTLGEDTRIAGVSAS